MASLSSKWVYEEKIRKMHNPIKPLLPAASNVILLTLNPGISFLHYFRTLRHETTGCLQPKDFLNSLSM